MIFFRNENVPPVPGNYYRQSSPTPTPGPGPLEMRNRNDNYDDGYSYGYAAGPQPYHQPPHSRQPLSPQSGGGGGNGNALVAKTKEYLKSLGVKCEYGPPARRDNAGNLNNYMIQQ